METKASVLGPAFLLAQELHAEQRRKASLPPGVPVLGHLLEVAGMVLGAGGSEVAAAAALLHDSIEDVSGAARVRIQTCCGSAVLTLVESCTEPGTGNGPKAPWRERKEGYLAHLQDASQEVLLISVADKLQSARDLLRVARYERAQGFHTPALWGNFTAGREGLLWFLRAFLVAARDRQAGLDSSVPLWLGTKLLHEELEQVWQYLHEYP